MSEVQVRTSSVQMIDSAGETQAPSVVSTLSRIRTSASMVVPYVSYGASRLGKLGIVGLSLCVFSVIAFVSSNVPLRQELVGQVSELDTARLDATSQRSADAANTPQAQASRFVANLPTPNDVPRIMGSIVAVAAATGIELKSGSYEFVSGADDSIAQYQMSLPVTGSYPQVRQFVENVLATVPAISLESLRLERDKVADQVIAADLKFSILLGGSS